MIFKDTSLLFIMYLHTRDVKLFVGYISARGDYQLNHSHSYIQPYLTATWLILLIYIMQHLFTSDLLLIYYQM